MLPRNIESLFAPAAHLVKPERREPTDQCKAACEREEEGEHIRPEHKPRQHKTDHRIDQAEKHRVAWHREEIVDAASERLLQINEGNFPDLRLRLFEAFTADDVRMGHAFLLRLKDRKVTGSPQLPATNSRPAWEQYSLIRGCLFSRFLDGLQASRSAYAGCRSMKSATNVQRG